MIDFSTAPLIPADIRDPRTHAFAREIKDDASVVSVKVAGKLKPVGNCYWNVAHVVQESGGLMQCGWKLDVWPDYYIVAMHHAVWRRPSGELLDVTESDITDGGAPKHNTFLPDDRIVIDLYRAQPIPSRYWRLSDAPEIDEIEMAYSAIYVFEQELASLYWELGYRGEANFAKAAGRPRPAGFVLDLGNPHQSAIAERIHRLHGALEAARARKSDAIAKLRRRPRGIGGPRDV